MGTLCSPMLGRWRPNVPAEKSYSAFAALTSPVVSRPLLPVEQSRCSYALNPACETIVRLVSRPLAPLEPAVRCLCVFVALPVTLHHGHLFGRLSNMVHTPTRAPVAVRDVMHVCAVTSARRCKVILGSSPHLYEAFGVLKRLYTLLYKASRG